MKLAAAKAAKASAFTKGQKKKAKKKLKKAKKKLKKAKKAVKKLC